MTDLEIEKCKLPTCINERNKKHDLPVCTSCMVLTVRRMMYANGDVPSVDYFEKPGVTPTPQQVASAGFWWRHVLANIDNLVEQGKGLVEKYGEAYDRDSETPWIREVKDKGDE